MWHSTFAAYVDIDGEIKLKHFDQCYIFDSCKFIVLCNCEYGVLNDYDDIKQLKKQYKDRTKVYCRTYDIDYCTNSLLYKLKKFKCWDYEIYYFKNNKLCSVNDLENDNDGFNLIFR